MKYQLKTEQQSNVDKLFKSLETFGFAYDTSVTGAGKTFIMMELFKRLGGFLLVTVSPTEMTRSQVKNTLQKYIKHLDFQDEEEIITSEDDEHSIRKAEVIQLTYSNLAGQHPKLKTGQISATKEVSHGLLDYTYAIKATENRVTYSSQFSITDSFAERLEELENHSQAHRRRMVLWLDEAHYLRNRGTSKWLAAKELILQFRNRGGYVLLASATPASKPEHKANLMEMLGEVRMRSPKSIKSFFTEWTAYKPEVAKVILDELNIDDIQDLPNSKRAQVVKQIFDLIVKPQVLSGIELNLTVICDLNNVTTRVSADVWKAYQVTIQQMKEDVEEKNSVMGSTRELVELERLKIDSVVELARQKLSQDPNKKVLICYNYLANGQELEDKLAEYRPINVSGKMKQSDREKAKKRFNQHNSKLRLLIFSRDTMSTGCDLDDTSESGTYPREMFIMPSYFFHTLCQLPGRIHRQTTTSNSAVKIVYLRNQQQETLEELSLYRNIYEKSGVMGEILSESTTGKSLSLPGEFPLIHL